MSTPVNSPPKHIILVWKYITGHHNLPPQVDVYISVLVFSISHRVLGYIWLDLGDLSSILGDPAPPQPYYSAKVPSPKGLHCFKKLVHYHFLKGQPWNLEKLNIKNINFHFLILTLHWLRICSWLSMLKCCFFHLHEGSECFIVQ